MFPEYHSRQKPIFSRSTLSTESAYFDLALNPPAPLPAQSAAASEATVGQKPVTIRDIVEFVRVVGEAVRPVLEALRSLRLRWK